MISTQILIYVYTAFNTLCGSNVVVHHFIQKALPSLTGAHVISTFSVRIKTATIVFKLNVSDIFRWIIVGAMFSCQLKNTYIN